MRIIVNLAAKIMAIFAVVSALALPASAEALNSDDLAVAFGKSAQTMGIDPADVVFMTEEEMRATEGAVAPLVAVGVMSGGRFIVQRYVTQRVAAQLARNGKHLLATNRQQAAAIARNASGGKKPIREFHPGPGQRFTHYHTNPRNGGHVWYGRPRR